MARITVEGSEFVLQLTLLERAISMLGDVRVPMTDVESVHGVDNPWKVVRGIRMGAFIPHVLLIGRMVRRGAPNDIVAIRGTRPAVVVTLRPGAAYGRIIVTDALPAMESRLAAARV